MVPKENLSKGRKIIIIAIFIIFLSLVLFYKWQLSTSGGYLFLGNESYKNKEYDESLRNYKFAETIDGSRMTIYLAKLKRAEIFYNNGFLDKAEEELKEAIKEVKNDFRAYEVMGDVYYAKGNISDSISYYKKSIELEDEERISIKLAKSFIANGQIDKASDIFSKLYSENSNEDEVLYYLGLLGFYENQLYNNYFQEIGVNKNTDYDLRIVEIKNYLNNYGDTESEIYNDVLIADLYNRINEPYLAIAKSKLIIEKNQNYRDAWIVLGESNFIIGDYRKSYDNFNKALELDGHNSEIYLWLGSVSQKLGNDLEAKEFMDKYRALMVE